MSERKDYRIHNINSEFREPKSIAPLPDTNIQPFDITDAEIAAASKVLNSPDPCFDMGNTPHWAKPLSEGKFPFKKDDDGDKDDGKKKNPFQKADDKAKDKDEDDGDDDDDDSDDKKGDKKTKKLVVKVEEGAPAEKMHKLAKKPVKTAAGKPPAEAMHKEPAGPTTKKRIGKPEAEKMHKLLKSWKK